MPLPAPSLEKARVDPPAEVRLCIRDRANDYRACITEDGTCINNVGEILGYINFDTLEAGAANEEYLGHMRSDYVIEDAADVVVGSLDMGLAKVRDHKGSTIADILGTGEVQGHAGTYLGQFEGFGYQDMQIVALYLLLIDTGMTNEIEG